jgi:NAD(P)-dependent dehydrogenase (short-subunit alcohol dehydrogenase family)
MGQILRGKNAVVTGGANGIGRETCLAFAAQGANIVVADYGSNRGGEGADKAPADKVVDEIKAKGGKAVSFFGSVADFKTAGEMINTCVKTFGKIDILVNLAGILKERMVWNMTEEEWDSVVDVHLKGHFNCVRWAAGFMREQRSGRILNTTSEAWKGVIGQSNYSAAKGGIVSFTKSVAKEMGKYGVTVNAIAPLAGTRMTLTPEVIASAKKQFEMGVISKEFYETSINMPGPEFIPPLLVYLASDKAANINGQIFHVKKGKIAIYNEPEEKIAIFTNDNNGLWTFEELEKLVPQSLLTGYVNPSPPEASKEKK